MASAAASDISRPLAAGQTPAARGGGQLQVPVEYFKLKNGLKVVLSRGLGDQDLASYVKRVMAVTPDDVRRVANQYLTPDKMTLVVVGDTKSVQEQVVPWSKKVIEP